VLQTVLVVQAVWNGSRIYIAQNHVASLQLTVICYISSVIIYQCMTSCVVVLFCSFANAFFTVLFLCSLLLIMTSSTHGI